MMTLDTMHILALILIVDGLFLVWMMRPRPRLTYGRETRASLRNGRKASFRRDA